MNITTLRKQTADALAAKEARKNAEFDVSPLRKYIDQRIRAEASQGRNKLELNFYYVKERILGDKYSGPTINETIRHYSKDGFCAWETHWLSQNGNGHTALVISWR